MPTTTTTYTLSDEYDRLDQRADKISDEASRVDEDSARYSELVEEGIAIDSRLGGLQWALDEWGEDAEVTVGGLTKGEIATVNDTSKADAQRVIGAGDDQPTDGVESVRRVGMGLRDAPELPDNASFEQRVAFVRDLQPQFGSWLELHVNKETSYEGNSKSFLERVSEKRASQNKP